LHFFNRIAKKYVDSTYSEIADQVLSRVGNDPVTVAVTTARILNRNKVAIPDRFWSFLPEGIEPNQHLDDFCNGIDLILDRNPEHIHTLAITLLKKAGYTDQANSLEKHLQNRV